MCHGFDKMHLEMQKRYALSPVCESYFSFSGDGKVRDDLGWRETAAVL